MIYSLKPNIIYNVANKTLFIIKQKQKNLINENNPCKYKSIIIKSTRNTSKILGVQQTHHLIQQNYKNKTPTPTPSSHKRKTKNN